MIILAHTASYKSIKAETDKHKINKWVYLSRDYSKLMWLESNLTIDRIETGEKLAIKSCLLRQTFHDLMDHLSQEQNPLLWWGMKISEKHHIESGLFLKLCQLQVAIDECNDNNNICIVSDSEGMIEILSNLYPTAKKLKHKTTSSLSVLATKWGRVLRYTIAQLIKSALAAALTTKLTTRSSSAPSYLILSYAQATSFGNDGEYHDKYYGTLSDWLSKRGYDVFTCIMILNLKKGLIDSTKWFVSVFNWSRKAKGNKFLVYSYLRPLDYFFPLKLYFMQQRIKLKKAELNGINIDNLIREELYAEEPQETALHYILAKRLSEHGIIADIYLDANENLLPERFFRMGVRKFMPEAKLFSYQVAPLFPNYLSMFFGKKDSAFTPDIIVASSKIMVDIYMKLGVPKEKLRLGPTLRHSYVHDSNNDLKNHTNTVSEKRIAIVLPFTVSGSLELIIKCIREFENENGYEILIKAHPTNKAAVVASLATLNITLPSSFSFSDENIPELINTIDCFICGGSSTLLEFCVLGVSYVNAASEIDLPHDPSEWFNSCASACYTASEIKASVVEALNGAASCKGLSANDLYEPLSEKALEAFLP